GIFLSVNNGQEGFQLPVNPKEIVMADGNDSSTYNISNLGEINVIKDKMLSEFSFDSFFPSKQYSFLATNNVLSPNSYVKHIQRWMADKTPIRFIFTGNSFDINTLVSIDSFEW